MKITDDVILEDYFDKSTIKPLKRETLIKRLKLLEPKYCPKCWNRLKFKSTKWATSKFCSHKCSIEYAAKKSKEAIKKKYWVENISQVPEINEKRKQNNLKKYWYDNVFSVPEIVKKIHKSHIEKYWCVVPANNKDLKKEWIKKNIEKYWVEYPFILPKNRQKLITNIRKKAINKNFPKNASIIDWWYKYSCNICWKITYYLEEKEKTNFLQRARLWFLPCKNCLSNKWFSQRSSIEILLEEEIKKYWIKTIHKNEIDIFLPDYNIWIEVNWIYWHSEKNKDKNYHKNKIKKFNQKWIQLLFFTDYEIKTNITKVINYILWKVWKLPSIWASKCKIKEIDTKTAKNFCEAYHIHWYAWWFKKYWLYYKEELVSVCVIWKNRFNNKKKSLEIIRLANSKKVIGWFWRFLKRILLDNSEYKIVTTYIDAFLWLPLNNVFIRYWFKYEWWTQPNYKWILKHKVLSRYNTQKHKLLAKWYKWKTEEDIMTSLWAYKIYDGWNYKFTYKASNSQSMAAIKIV